MGNKLKKNIPESLCCTSEINTTFQINPFFYKSKSSTQPACVCVFSCSVTCDSLRPRGLSSARLLCPRASPPGDLPNSGIEPGSLALAGWYFTTSATCEAHRNTTYLGKTYSTHSYVGHSQELEIKGLLSSQSLFQSSCTLLRKTTLAQPPRNRFQPQGLWPKRCDNKQQKEEGSTRKMQLVF